MVIFMAIWLVVWNMFDFCIYWEQSLTIIPTDFHIFQRGRYTTNQLCFWLNTCLWSVSHLDFYVVQRRSRASPCPGGAAWGDRDSEIAIWCLGSRGISRMGLKEEMPQVYGTFWQSWMMAEWWIPKFMAHCGNFLMVEWWQNDDWRWDSYVYIKVNMMLNCINCIKLSGTLFSGRPKVKLDSSVLFQLCLFAANDSGWWSPMTSVRLCFFNHRPRM